ncbi:NAD(P)-dependent alcohol dehydrogenase [Urechidicola vernalis]|uniref:NAD(P)-dependent alcohol dehydrogenase n=1 Tax=Urechidicola vernalis TaxID=3075600 RepID=A0ABU2Y1V6_9FLAO|nr:NAD(P)-dependent alcohol dehydrogenase [Urechidicola sp. P050]MDT0551786.1 NAD(P)-dependent alcohol dehydrogenase [Urechidicola sp. P050]
MKAAIHKKYGSPSNLKIIDLKKPAPKEDELLIRVMATTVNRTDCAMLRAKPAIIRLMLGLLKPKNPILGTDFAGVVEDIGHKVTRFKVGQAVFGFNDTGLSSHAEYLTIRQNDFLATIPSKFSFEQATASIEGAHYAQNFINKVNFKPNAKVLVNGATGAIGSALVQLLAAMKIDVTATANTENINVIKTLGVTQVIDYTKIEFTQLNEKFDFVFDAVGKSAFGKCRRILTKKGIYISSEMGPWGQNLVFAIFTPLFKGRKVVFPYPNKHQYSIDLVKRLMEEGKFNPLIDRIYALDNIASAFSYAETGEKVGNLVIKMKNE